MWINTFLRTLLVVALSGALQQQGSTSAQDQNQGLNNSSIHAAIKTPRSAVVYSDRYLINLFGLERLHPFDIKKYKKISDQLVKDKLLDQKQIISPSEVTREQLLLVHQEQYLEKLKDKNKVADYLEAQVIKQVPLPVDSGILKPFRFATGGTIVAARQALKNGIGINIGGGYHHAKPDKGEGFCIYADIPIAIRLLQKEKVIERALIIDVDAHQGNGTICCLDKDNSTFTFSMHQSGIYPNPKEIGDWDIELDAETGDQEYLEVLKKALPKLFEKSKPNIVFIVGGCDTLDDDPLTSLGMTDKGICKRDMMIVDACVERQTPVVLTMAGGYSKDAWKAQYLSIKGILKKYPVAAATEQKTPN